MPRRRIVPIAGPEPEDAFTRDFAPPPPGLRILPVYCGMLRPAPQNRSIGTPTQCFKKGLRSGFAAGIQKGKAQARQGQRTRELLTATLTKQQIAKEIEDKGINFLKQQLHLSKLTKDLIRSIATKLTGTPNQIVGYSKMKREELIQRLVALGFKE